jgi:hypothetical protein
LNDRHAGKQQNHTTEADARNPALGQPEPAIAVDEQRCDLLPGTVRPTAA